MNETFKKHLIGIAAMVVVGLLCAYFLLLTNPMVGAGSAGATWIMIIIVSALLYFPLRFLIKVLRS